MDSLLQTSPFLRLPVSSENQLEKLRGQLSSAEELKGRKKVQELWKIAQGFEELFINQLMRTMRHSDMEVDENEDEIFKKSNAQKIYEGMFDEGISAEMAKRRDFGLSRIIFNWLTRMQPELRKFSAAPRQAVSAYQAARVVHEKG